MKIRNTLGNLIAGWSKLNNSRRKAFASALPLSLLILGLVAPPGNAKAVFEGITLSLPEVQVGEQILSLSLELVNTRNFTFQLDLQNIGLVSEQAQAACGDPYFAFSSEQLIVPVLEVGDARYQLFLDLIDAEQALFQLNPASPLLTSVTDSATPALTVWQDGNNLALEWGSPDDGSAGYRVWYTPYQSIEPLDSLDVSSSTSVAVELPSETDFCLAVTSYGPDGDSDLSPLARFTNLEVPYSVYYTDDTSLPALFFPAQNQEQGMALLHDAATDQPYGAVFLHDEEEDDLVLAYDPIQGLLARIMVGKVAYQFDNYTATTVDVIESVLDGETTAYPDLPLTNHGISLIGTKNGHLEAPQQLILANDIDAHTLQRADWAKQGLEAGLDILRTINFEDESMGKAVLAHLERYANGFRGDVFKAETGADSVPALEAAQQMLITLRDQLDCAGEPGYPCAAYALNQANVGDFLLTLPQSVTAQIQNLIAELTGEAGEPTEVALGASGKIVFPEGSLPVGTPVTVVEVPLPALTTDLEAVGKAWQVEVGTQPSLPVEVSLPVPFGEDPDSLIVVRRESIGRITLLQSQVEDGMLVALTPGFSTLVVARLSERLKVYKPRISGPDTLPVGVVGQYQEDSLKSIPGLNRKWYRFNGTSMESELTYDSDPMTNNSARFKGLTSGNALLRVHYQIEDTFVFAEAYKRVTVQEEIAIFNDGLELAIYGPTVVKTNANDAAYSEPFKVTGRILNTDEFDIASWDLSGLPGGPHECNSDCGKIFTIDGAVLPIDQAGTTTLTIRAQTTGGTIGEATLQVRVLDRKPKILEINGLDAPQDWSQFLQPPHIAFSATAWITGGLPPYRYEWGLQPTDQTTTHESASNTDGFDFALDQPGEYHLELTVTDSMNEMTSSTNAVFLKPVPDDFPTRHVILEPTEAVVVGQPVTLRLSVFGGYLISEGEKYNYSYGLDWGDSAEILDGHISADRVEDGGTLFATHTYTAPGSYTLRFAADSKSDVQPEVAELSELMENWSTWLTNKGLMSTAVINVEPAPDNHWQVCPPTVTANPESNPPEVLTFSAFTRYESSQRDRCEYSRDGVDNAHVYVELSHGEGNSNLYACGQDGQWEFSGVGHYAFSTQRQLSVTVGSFNYPLAFSEVWLFGEEAVLGAVLTTAVDLGIGKACPGPSD